MSKVIVKTTYPILGQRNKIEVIYTNDPNHYLKAIVGEKLEELSVEKRFLKHILEEAEDSKMEEILSEDYEIYFQSNDSLYFPETDSTDAVRYDIVDVYDEDDNPVDIKLA